MGPPGALTGPGQAPIESTQGVQEPMYTDLPDVVGGAEEVGEGEGATLSGSEGQLMASRQTQLIRRLVAVSVWDAQEQRRLLLHLH